MRIVYRPAVNGVVRGALRPFRRWLPARFQVPVNGVVRLRLPEGQVVRLAANPTSYLARVLYWEGLDGYEPDLLRVFLALARRSETFIDVGAALGYYALVAAAVNPRARIVAFEPGPDTFRYLERNVRINAAVNVTAEQVAISDAPGRASFYVTQNPKHAGIPQLAGTSGLDEREAARGGAVPRKVEVEVDTLDRYAARKLGRARIDLLKLDTEATEDRVLAGAERLLAEHRPIILCEVLRGRIESALEEVLGRHDYVFARATHGGLRATDRLIHGAEVPNDHVMIPRERIDYVRSVVAYTQD